MRHAVSLSVVLAITWMLLSGHTEALLIAFGVASILLVAVIIHRMDMLDHEGHSLHVTLNVFVYWPWLIWQILKSNIDVAKVILSNEPVRPVMFRVRPAQKSSVVRVVFANSITLTPGTVTVAIDENEFLVHALTPAGADDLADDAHGMPSQMNRLCARIDDRITQREPSA